jgi:TusA-related sulfurtransferase
MAREIDVRGLSCPQPVLLTKKAMDAGEIEIVVIADDAVARDNVRRLARSSGYDVQIEEREGDFVLTLVKDRKD